MGVDVHHRRIVPRVVRVACDIAGRPLRSPRIDQRINTCLVVPHVERDNLRRTQAVVGLEDATALRAAHLLGLTLNPEADTDAALFVECLFPPDHVARVGVHEVRHAVAHQRLVCQHEAVRRQGQDHQFGRIVHRRAGAGPRVHLRQRVGGRDGGHRVDIHRLVQRPEDRNRQAVLQLTGDAGAVDPHPLVVLLKVLVRAPRHLPIRQARDESQPVRASHRIYAGIDLPQFRQVGRRRHYCNRGGPRDCHLCRFLCSDRGERDKSKRGRDQRRTHAQGRRGGLGHGWSTLAHLMGGVSAAGVLQYRVKPDPSTTGRDLRGRGLPHPSSQRRYRRSRIITWRSSPSRSLSPTTTRTKPPLAEISRDGRGVAKLPPETGAAGSDRSTTCTPASVSAT